MRSEIDVDLALATVCMMAAPCELEPRSENIGLIFSSRLKRALWLACRSGRHPGWWAWLGDLAAFSPYPTAQRETRSDDSTSIASLHLGLFPLGRPVSHISPIRSPHCFLGRPQAEVDREPLPPRPSRSLPLPTARRDGHPGKRLGTWGSSRLCCIAANWRDVWWSKIVLGMLSIAADPKAPLEQRTPPAGQKGDGTTSFSGMRKRDANAKRGDNWRRPKLGSASSGRG